VLNTYLAPGIAEHVTFDVHAGARKGSGYGDCAEDSYSCADEVCGCPITRWVLCGLHATRTSQDQQIKFLTCVDQLTVAYSDEWALQGEMPNPMQATMHCANQTGLKLDAVQRCGGNITSWESQDNFTEVGGKQGWKLLDDAAEYMKEAFPDGLSLPNLRIDEEEQSLDTLVDMWNVTKRLCAHMKERKAEICSVVDSAREPGWVGMVV